MKRILSVVVLFSAPVLFAQCYFSNTAQETINISVAGENYISYYGDKGIIKVSKIVEKNNVYKTIINNKEVEIKLILTGVPSIKIGYHVYDYFADIPELDYSSCKALRDIEIN